MQVECALFLDLSVRVLAAVKAGVSHREAGERLGVRPASLSRWGIIPCPGLALLRTPSCRWVLRPVSGCGLPARQGEGDGRGRLSALDGRRPDKG